MTIQSVSTSLSPSASNRKRLHANICTYICSVIYVNIYLRLIVSPHIEPDEGAIFQYVGVCHNRDTAGRPSTS
jgi:hypothetical protein